MHQRKYTLEIISEASLSVAKPTTTQLDPYVQLSTKQYDEANDRDNTDSLLKDPSIYRRLVGNLLYLTLTIPDISFASHTLAQFLQQLKQSHLNVVVRVLKYIKGQAVL